MRTRVRIAFLSNNGRLPVLLDDEMQPLELPLRYIMDRCYFNEAWRSIENRLQTIGQFYRHFSARGVSIDARLKGPAVFGLDELSRFFLWLENKDRDNPEIGATSISLLSTTNYNNSVSYVADYVAWAIECFRGKFDIGPGRGLEAARDAAAVKAVVLRHRRSGRSRTSQLGLSDGELKRLSEMIRPGAADNPFRPSKQFAYEVIVNLFLETGIRAGEAMYLRASDMDLWGSDPVIRVEQRIDFKGELRRSAPSIKTYDRILPISHALARSLAIYERKVRGSVRHPYALVTPRDRKPLGQRNLAKIFASLSKQLGFRVHPHRLRNTYFDGVLRIGAKSIEEADPEKKEIILTNHLKYLGGWSHRSKMPAYYTRGEAGNQAREIHKKYLNGLYK